ncbi:ribosome biogenesis GTP-binding protein YihA/YsxC [Limnovirga soli]|jgi:GTP-binding protein|uniref:Probable GTP-binding protein EngB n=1 Tax=Limnovirga soli TaxID=2656915 RepID=A0A8J8FHS0_9BACT|nr:ribosome biogenesis GTP-binding protein YihA/YsxC [Limnovirga soli]NNV56842.1 YihA family ribosome biogenesis GTP-binding protein [Limnovirga soli]
MIIKEALYVISSPTVETCPKPDKPEYAFIGRSNVGKSSLINMLCNREKLAKTSATPGKTKIINHFLINKSWYIVDLPGYGYAKISQSQRRQWEQMIENYLRKRENLVNVFILIDARHSPQANDLEFIHNLGKWEIPFTLVFTKADKEKPAVVERNVKAFADKLRESWQFLPRQFITSAEKKTGRDEILQFIDECNKAIEAANKP